MILNVQNISKQFDQGNSQIQALSAINFQMDEGESLAIVGPSGSGKTTLLSLLAGLDEPSSGSIHLAGENLNHLDEKALSEFRARNMGIVFQQFHLMPSLSALENVKLPLEISAGDNVTNRATEALKQVGLAERIHHRPDQLSGGECQRVAIARALVTEPKILLADEPSGNLDTKTGESVMTLLFDLAKEKKMTLILVTHNLEHAKLCQRQIELSAGSIQ